MANGAGEVNLTSPVEKVTTEATSTRARKAAADLCARPSSSEQGEALATAAHDPASQAGSTGQCGLAAAPLPAKSSARVPNAAATRSPTTPLGAKCLPVHAYQELWASVDTLCSNLGTVIRSQQRTPTLYPTLSSFPEFQQHTLHRSLIRCLSLSSEQDATQNRWDRPAPLPAESTSPETFVATAPRQQTPFLAETARLVLAVSQHACAEPTPKLPERAVFADRGIRTSGGLVGASPLPKSIHQLYLALCTQPLQVDAPSATFVNIVFRREGGCQDKSDAGSTFFPTPLCTPRRPHTGGQDCTVLKTSSPSLATFSKSTAPGPLSEVFYGVAQRPEVGEGGNGVEHLLHLSLHTKAHERILTATEKLADLLRTKGKTAASTCGLTRLGNVARGLGLSSQEDKEHAHTGPRAECGEEASHTRKETKRPQPTPNILQRLLSCADPSQPFSICDGRYYEVRLEQASTYAQNRGRRTALSVSQAAGNRAPENGLETSVRPTSLTENNAEERDGGTELGETSVTPAACSQKGQHENGNFTELNRYGLFGCGGAFKGETEKSALTDTQQHRCKGISRNGEEVRGLTRAVEGGLPDAASQKERSIHQRPQNSVPVAPVSPFPQADPLVGGCNCMSRGMGDESPKSEGISNGGAKLTKCADDTEYAEMADGRYTERLTIHQKKVRTARGDGLRTDRYQACNAASDVGGKASSSPVSEVDNMRSQRPRPEGNSWAEETRAGQECSSGSPATEGRQLSFKTSCEEEESHRVGHSCGNSQLESKTDKDTNCCTSKRCRTMQHAEPGGHTVQMQVSAWVAPAAGPRQTSICAEEGDSQKGRFAATESRSHPQPRKNCGDSGGFIGWSRSGALLCSGAAARKQASEGNTFVSREAAETNLNVKKDRTARTTSDDPAYNGTSGDSEAQHGAEHKGRRATEQTARAHCRTAGTTDSSMKSGHEYYASLLQKPHEDGEEDSPISMSPLYRAIWTHTEQVCQGTRADDEVAADRLGGAYERSKHILGSLKKRRNHGHAEQSRGGDDSPEFPGYSEEADSCLLRSPVGPRSLAHATSETNLAADGGQQMPRGLKPCSPIEDQIAADVPPRKQFFSGHLSDGEAEPTYRCGAPSCRRGNPVNADALHIISQRSAAKFTSKCTDCCVPRLRSYSRRRHLSAHGALLPSVNVSESQSSTVIYSLEERFHQAVSAGKVRTLQTSPDHDVLRTTSYTGRSARVVGEMIGPSDGRPRTGTCLLNDTDEKKSGKGCDLHGASSPLQSQSALLFSNQRLSKMCCRNFTPEGGCALGGGVHELPNSITLRTVHGSMSSPAEDSPSCSRGSAPSSAFYYGARRRLPPSSAAGCIRAASALHESVFDKSTREQQDAKSNQPQDIPATQKSDGVQKVLEDFMCSDDGALDGSAKADKNRLSSRFTPNTAAPEARRHKKMKRGGHVPVVEILGDMTLATDESTSLVWSFEDPFQSGFLSMAESTCTGCKGGWDRPDDVLSPVDACVGRPEASHLCHPPSLRERVTHPPPVTGLDPVIKVRSNVFMRSRCRQPASRHSRLTKPFKPPAAAAPGRTEASPPASFCKTARQLLTAESVVEKEGMSSSIRRLPSGSARRTKPTSLSPLLLRKKDASAASSEAQVHAETAGDQRRQDLTMLLRVAGVAPGDVLEVRLPYFSTEAKLSNAGKEVHRNERVCTKPGSDAASTQASPMALPTTTRALGQHIQNRRERRGLSDGSANVAPLRPDVVGTLEDAGGVAEESGELLTGPEQNVLRGALLVERATEATASTRGFWVQAEVILPETREIDEHSRCRVMQLTYKNYPGLSTKVIFLGFSHLFCLESSYTVNTDETPHRKVRRVGDQRRSCILRVGTPSGCAQLMAAFQRKILEFRKSGRVFAEPKSKELPGALSALDLFEGGLVGRAQTGDQSRAVERASLKAFTKLPLTTASLLDMDSFPKDFWYGILTFQYACRQLASLPSDRPLYLGTTAAPPELHRARTSSGAMSGNRKL